MNRNLSYSLGPPETFCGLGALRVDPPAGLSACVDLAVPLNRLAAIFLVGAVAGRDELAPLAVLDLVAVFRAAVSFAVVARLVDFLAGLAEDLAALTFFDVGCWLACALDVNRLGLAFFLAAFGVALAPRLAPEVRLAGALVLGLLVLLFLGKAFIPSNQGVELGGDGRQIL